MKTIYLNFNGKPERLGILPDSLPDAGAADEMHSPAGTRSQTIPAGTPWKTPVYVAGAHRLEVFLDGLACVAGDAGNAQYSEAGAPGESSDSITFHFDVTPESDVLFRLK